MQTAPHLIRLRGPWEWRAASGDAQAGRVTLPADWLAGLEVKFAGSVRFSRKFQQPGPLGGSLPPETAVWLAMSQLPTDASVSLNGEALSLILHQDQAARQNITTLLQPRNELWIDVSVTGDRELMLTEVWLEIHEPGQTS